MNKIKKWIITVTLMLIVLATGLAACAPQNTVTTAPLDRWDENGLARNEAGNGNSQAVSVRNNAGGPGRRGPGGYGQNSGAAITPLSGEEADALQKAILEEYGALNLYQSVIEQFGSVSPFSQIVQSEQQHVNALTRQAEKYGIEIPANPGLSDPPAFSTLAEACQAGVNAELADANLYDQLKTITQHEDLLGVYDSLQSASLQNHLPAFQACQ
ncbi:MAG: hypothetical protein HPY59_14260 [Anaerolineae bacterium]|nr:hypothetical protein [Anaerolineae bacterium]